MAADLAIIIKAKDQASGVLSHVGKNTDGLSSKLKMGLGVAAVGAAGAIGALAVAGIGFVKAAAQEQASVARLEAAVRATGYAYEDAGVVFDDFIKKGEKLAFSDDVQRDALAILTTQTGDYKEAQRRAAIAMDFSRGANIDLVTASKLLGKVTDENVNVLARYGIRATEGMDATALLAEVQSRFAGQSETFAGTAAGKWERFNIALDNIKESIGAALLPLVTSLGEKLAIFLEENQDDIERMVEDFRVFAEDVLPKIEAFVAENVLPQIAEAIDELTEAWAQLNPLLEDAVAWLKDNEEAALALGIALGLLVAWIAGPLIAIPALIAVGVLLLANWDEIKAKAAEVWMAVSNYVQNAYEVWSQIPILGEIIEFTFQTIQAVIESYIQIYLRLAQFLFDSLRNAFKFFDALFRGDWAAAWDAVKAQFGATLDAILDIFGIALSTFSTILSGYLEMLKGIGGDIAGKIVEGFGALGGLMGGVWDGVKRGAEGALNWIIDRVNEFINGINSIANLGGLLSAAGIDAPQIGTLDHVGGRRYNLGAGPSFMAAGGIVTRPTLAMIGEAGEPEAVIPLSQMPNEDSLAEKIAHAIARELAGALAINVDGRELARVVSRHTAYEAAMIGRGG